MMKSLFSAGIAVGFIGMVVCFAGILVTVMIGGSATFYICYIGVFVSLAVMLLSLVAEDRYYGKDSKAD